MQGKKHDDAPNWGDLASMPINEFFDAVISEIMKLRARVAELEARESE